jgi:hypothetical protein
MNIPDIIKSAYSGVSYITQTDFIICLAGILLFGGWLLKTSLGRKALSDSVPRRNNMPPYLPFVPLFIWFGAVSLAISVTEKLLPDLPDWQKAFLDNLILCIGAIMAMAVIIFLARVSFARRLKGFGLNLGTIHKDFPAALLNLLSVWPLIAAMIILTMRLGTRGTRTDKSTFATAGQSADYCYCCSNSARVRRDALSRAVSNNAALHFTKTLAVNCNKLWSIRTGSRKRRTLAGIIYAFAVHGICL